MPSPTARKTGLDAERLAIATVVLIAVILRIVNLNAGLWYDEVITLIQSVRLAPAELLVTYGSLNNHVLYTWLAKACVALFGEEPWALRAPALALGAASIAAAWLMFRESGYRWAAVAAAALLALSYHHVWFSQNARGYTGLLLFTTLAGLALHRALTTRERRYWFAYAAFFAISMLIHLSAAFLLAAQGLAVLLHGALVARREADASFWRWIFGPMIGFGCGSLIVLAVFAPMIGGMIETFGAVAGPAEPAANGVVEWKNPLWTVVEAVRSFGALGLAVPAALIFAGVGCRRLLRAAPWIAAPYLIHVPLTLALLSALSMRIWPRYFLVDIGFLTAAAVIGAFAFAEGFADRLKTKERFGIGATALKSAGFALMAIASVPLLLRNYAHPKQDFEGAYAYIEAQRQPADRVATLGLARVYYDDYRRSGWPSLSSVDQMKAEGDGRLWVVTSFPSHTRAFFPEEQALLDAEFDLAAKFEGTLSGGDVYVYRSRTP